MFVGYPTDMQCMDFTICKLGKVIWREEINKGNGTYLTYTVSGQPMFDSYQKETMIHPRQSSWQAFESTFSPPELN